MMNRRSLLSGMSALGLASVATSLRADTYPSQMIRYVVPFPAGGATDIIARVLAEKMQEQMGQTVIVENRGGAGGMTGTRSVAKAPPDGYQFLAATFNFLTMPVLFKNMDFDIVTDFAPITLLATFPMILVVHPSVKANSLKEFIDLCKSSGGLKFGSSSTGGGGHVAGELFNQRIGVKNLHVPYRGAAPMNTDLISGSIDFAFAHITSIMTLIRSKNVRALAIASDVRSPQFPDIPTMKEAGLNDFTAAEWNGALAPANTPRPIVDRLHKEIMTAIKRPEVRERLDQQGALIVGSTPDQFAEYIKTESVKWGAVAREAGLNAS